MDLICLGELLVDFVPTVKGKSLRDVPAFKKAAGGAPANVACGFSRLGGQSGFIGKVGDDEFGRFLEEALQECGVDTSHLLKSKEALTALAFVSLRADGDRDFAFYRNPSADMLLMPEEVPADDVRSARIFHFGSVSLIDEPVRSATLFAARVAHESCRLVSFDPNLRPPLWPSLEKARQAILNGMVWAGLLKVSDEELSFITGYEDHRTAVRWLFETYPTLRLIALTLGSEGSVLYTSDQEVAIPGFGAVAVDTTGAGDGFLAGLLLKINQAIEPGTPFDWSRPPRFWEEIGLFGNAVGAMVVASQGGIPAMPDLAAVEAFLQMNRR